MIENILVKLYKITGSNYKFLSIHLVGRYIFFYFYRLSVLVNILFIK